MHICLKFSNIDRRFNTNRQNLRGIIKDIQAIFPKEKVEVHVYYSFADTYEFDPESGAMIPVGPVMVSLYPLTGPVQKASISSQYPSLSRMIAELIHNFLAVSDPNNDPSVQPSYFPSSEIQISAGFGVSKFVDGEPEL